ncbi:MAG: beta-galactosidase [Paludibaculum sp.]
MLESGARARKEVWRQDVRQIRAQGFNALRAWIDWATGEPEEKKYNFETLDVLLELAQEEGLHLLVQVYMDSAPQWLGDKYPGARFVSAGGQVIQPETSPGYCRDHAGVRAADRAFYTALANHLKRSPAFLGFDLWSEPHVINWATPVFIDKPEFCYCPNSLARFRDWLQHKYGSLDRLNAAWYRSYRSWDQVEPGRMSTILSFTDYIDWKAFIVDKLGEDLHDRSDAVKQAAPDRLATSHAAGVGLFASPHHWEGQSDDWSMAPQVDYYGTSSTPSTPPSSIGMCPGALLCSTSPAPSVSTADAKASGSGNSRAASAPSPSMSVPPSRPPTCASGPGPPSPAEPKPSITTPGIP